MLHVKNVCLDLIFVSSGVCLEVLGMGSLEFKTVFKFRIGSKTLRLRTAEVFDTDVNGDC